VYLSYGLAFILAFIGVKLILHALHTNELPFLNGGEHFGVPEIPTWLSLAVIIVTLIVTAVASLAKSRTDPEAIKETEPVDPAEDRPAS
jgi:tellurite resistance protein TerC